MDPIELDEASCEPIPLRLKRKDGTTAEYLLPKLGIKRYAGWLKELTARRKEIARALLPKVPGKDRFLAERSIELDRATFDDVWREVQNEEGTERIIRMSMDAAGISAADQDLILDKLPTRIVTGLAMDLSTLFAPAAPQATPTNDAGSTGSPQGEGKQQAGPLAGQPVNASPTPATAPTG